jgi:TonB family protein
MEHSRCRVEEEYTMERIYFLSFIPLILISGCVETQQIRTEQPELLSMTALPPAPGRSGDDHFRLNVLFLILHDGTVADVKILGTTEDPKWDAAAIDSMKQWRFVPVQRDTVSSGRWIRVAVVVHTEEPVSMDIARIVTSNLKDADSLYLLLQQGIPFDTLARHIQRGGMDESVSELGTVDLARYPAHVRDILRTLTINSFSRPIRVGDEYHIYKRCEPARSLNVQ